MVHVNILRKVKGEGGWKNRSLPRDKRGRIQLFVEEAIADGKERDGAIWAASLALDRLRASPELHLIADTPRFCRLLFDGLPAGTEHTRQAAIESLNRSLQSRSREHGRWRRRPSDSRTKNDPGSQRGACQDQRRPASWVDRSERVNLNELFREHVTCQEMESYANAHHLKMLRGKTTGQVEIGRPRKIRLTAPDSSCDCSMIRNSFLNSGSIRLNWSSAALKILGDLPRDDVGTGNLERDVNERKWGRLQ